MRRGGGAGARPGRTFEQLDEVVGVALEHRPDKGAHHVAQEGVSGDLELDDVAAVVPAGVLDDADEGVVPRLGRREGAEVVLSDHHRGGCVQPRHLEAPRMPERAVDLERRPRPAPPDAVAIRARPRGEARVEVVGHLFRFEDRDVVGKDGVQRLCCASERRATIEVDGDDVRERMHPGVGAAGDLHAVATLVDLLERSAHDTLDGPLVRLPCPAVESGPYIGNGQLEAHANPFDTQES